MADDNIHQFLEEVQKQAKANILVFAGPLALVFAQLRTVNAIDSTLLKWIVTVSVLALVVGLYHSYKSKELVTFLLIKERQRAAGGANAEGYCYVQWAEAIYRKSGVDLNDEDSVLEVGKKSIPWIIGAMFAGYGGLGAVLLIVIWSNPT